MFDSVTLQTIFLLSTMLRSPRYTTHMQNQSRNPSSNVWK